MLFVRDLVDPQGVPVIATLEDYYWWDPVHQVFVVLEFVVSYVDSL